MEIYLDNAATTKMDCAEILGTDFSDEMIETANKNLLQSGRKNKRSLNRISLWGLFL